MLAWMSYVLVVSAFLSAAAFAAERAARIRGAQHRWIWVTAILASLFIPAAIASVSVELPAVARGGGAERPTPLRGMTSHYLSPTTWVGAVAPTLNDSPDADRLLKRGWAAMSLASLSLLLVSAAHLHFRKRRWSSAVIAGRNVFVADDVGPAVVGLLRPSIVAPRWLLARSGELQRMVLAHEQAHLEAHDQQVLAIALCLIVLMPWNLPLWWQVRRLRYAIEVDCDARVLGKGHALADYGEALIEVGQRRSGFVGAVAGMSESSSFLERRIAIMTSNRLNSWRLVSAGFACAAVACAAVAAQVSPPNAQSGKPQERRAISVEPAVLDRYAGEYRLDANMIVVVRRDGERLLAQLTGQPEFEIFPESRNKFFWKVVDAQATFVGADDQPAAALILHQHGQDMRAPRVDAGSAAQVQAALEAKIQSGSATPGSDAALKRLLESVRTGKPNYEEMEAPLAKVVRDQMPLMQPHLEKLGAVQSIRFHGVGAAGWDSYDVQHEHGSSQWRIALSSDGKIAGAMSVNLP